MAYPPYIRAKARELRVGRRLTIDQIAERMAVSRSTVYYWVRDLPVSDAVRHSGPRQSARRRGNRAMQRKYRLLRDAAYQDGLESFDLLAADPTFRDFVALYIAEGYKRNRNTVAICNSDPAVMELSTRWLRRLTEKQLQFWVHYHADQNRGELQRFWGHVLAIDPSDIRMTRKSNSGQLTGRMWRSRHGILTARVFDTLLRARVAAWMDRMRESWR